MTTLTVLGLYLGLVGGCGNQLMVKYGEQMKMT